MGWNVPSSPTNPHGGNILRPLLAILPTVPYTEQTAYEHARIWAEVESADKMIGFYDLIVAATALERGSEVGNPRPGRLPEQCFPPP